MLCCRDWKQWIESFFNELEMYDDILSGSSNKQELATSICRFLDDCCEKKAEQVYFNFFRAYWLGDEQSNPFLELIKKVSIYEQTAGSLIRNQRDHYCHAVNVFIIGLVVYHNSKRFQWLFHAFLSETDYKDAYSTTHEEFFYRWGLASLFHDVAYPLEITIKQLNEYYNYSVSYGNADKKKEFLKIFGFEKYKTCNLLSVKEAYKQEFKKKYGTQDYFTKTESCDLLSMDISKSLKIDANALSKEISAYEDKISQGIIDHAYFGALICLKWHSSLINSLGWNPAYFFYPVLDASSSIFLHNAYGHLIMEKISPERKLKIGEKPIAFLLILSDLLQEWNRKGFGFETSHDCPFKEVEFAFDDEMMRVNYVVDDSHKKDLHSEISNKLDLASLFANFSISYNQEVCNG